MHHAWLATPPSAIYESYVVGKPRAFSCNQLLSLYGSISLSLESENSLACSCASYFLLHTPRISCASTKFPLFGSRYTCYRLWLQLKGPIVLLEISTHVPATSLISLLVRGTEGVRRIAAQKHSKDTLLENVPIGQKLNNDGILKA